MMKWRNSLLGVLISIDVAGCTSTSATPQPTAPPRTATDAGVIINLTGSNQFEPTTIVVARGTTVTRRNTGLAPHTVTDDATKAAKPADALLPAGAQGWDSGQLNGGVGGGQSFSHTFDTPGEYSYFCIPHESLGMVGHITVT